MCDVRVVQRRGGLRLNFKAHAFFLAGGDLAWQEFDGDVAFEFRVLGFVDHAHAALTELRENFVMENGFTDHGSSPIFFKKAA